MTRSALLLSEGLTIEWRQMTPLTGEFWQEIWFDLAGLPLDSFRIGPGEPYHDPGSVASLRLPLLDYQPPVPSLAVVCDNAVRRPYPARLQERRWHAMAFQLHPGGGCDLIVDRRVHVSLPRGFDLRQRAPQRLAVGGRSHVTDMLLHDLRVWRGIRYIVAPDSTAVRAAQLRRGSEP